MNDSRLWFKAKEYGRGWGLATTWQGWAVYAAYAVLAVASAVWLPAARHPLAFGCSIVGLTALLVGICWLKGETPRWRWVRS